MTIGRRPDSDVFLDDVTVSRDHALLVRRGGDCYLDDLGSLNGTYVNRHRIESHRLEDGDELQVGKYKLTFLAALTGRPGAPAHRRSRRARRPRAKAMTIGAVCKALEQEFPDISISKIRYLEDQKLLAPRRTPGGYRLYTPGRRRAAAHHPAPAARRVPAAARHPPGARVGPRGPRRSPSSQAAAEATSARPRGAARA